MSFSRRRFIQTFGVIAGGIAANGSIPKVFSKELESSWWRWSQLSDEDAITDEQFWYEVKQQYTVNSNLINFNNGGVSPQPKPVQDEFLRFNELSNEAPSYYMWRVLDKGREPLRKKLAKLAGVSSEEISICRNTTEALETVIFGLPLQKGDEVVLTKQDYPSMINAWKQREKREGIKLTFINLNLPEENDDILVKAFTDAFSSKTKVVQITHMINWNGQLLPARKIADAAKKKGIEVLVDGAHTFAHLDFKISDLNCDYFGTSLHKWLCAPFGTGMLYVRKEKISKVWPLFANDKPGSDDITKFEHLGTRSIPSEQAIGKAIYFHQMIGAQRKEKRLRYLKNYWIEKVRNLPKVKIHTSTQKDYGCGIGLFSIDGMEISDIDRTLFNDYKIHAVAINWENINGVRISPNVYTVTSEMDVLVEAITKMAS